MQVILGAGGAIGISLAKELPQYTDKIRLVSRNPQKVNEKDELFPADLTDSQKVKDAVSGCDVAYLTAGLQYNTKVWQNTWPLIMGNVIDACKQHKVKLLFFDNIYMYDPDHLNPMDEQTPINPCSKKGEVRRQIAQMLLDKIEAGNVQGLIARAADFYGPVKPETSVLMATVVDNFNKGKKANWLCSVDYKHSFTFTPDAAKACAILGNDDSAYGQVWHLPTEKDPPTGKQWIEAFAKAMKKEPKYQVAGPLLVKLIGLFNPIMKEIYEMLYQYDRDYVFDSSKFEKKYNFTPTRHEEAIKQILR